MVEYSQYDGSEEKKLLRENHNQTLKIENPRPEEHTWEK